LPFPDARLLLRGSEDDGVAGVPLGSKSRDFLPRLRVGVAISWAIGGVSSGVYNPLGTLASEPGVSATRAGVAGNVADDSAISTESALNKGVFPATDAGFRRLRRMTGGGELSSPDSCASSL
jgi:hypothetical protein